MSLVSTTFEGDIAVVTIDNPPVSTGNVGMRSALFDAFGELRGEPDVHGIVLRSVQSHFYSGSDIREFDGEIPRPSLPEVIDLMERIEVPIVAALNGLTLGGGLEFALASDVRIASSDAKLGLPEVTLGLLPGAGGTVRLPRLIGVIPAIDIIASGKPVTADRALELRLVDEVVAHDQLLETALERASASPKRRALHAEVDPVDEDELKAAIARAGRRGRARPNVVQAVDLVVKGAQVDGAVALHDERRVFDELRVGPESRNLRYLFFAKRDAAKDLKTDAATAKISKVAIAGAGTMGSAIASEFLRVGLDVTLYEVSTEVLDRARARLMGQDDDNPRRGALVTTTDIADMAGAELVVDAVFEDMGVKSGLLEQLNRVCRADAVIASNTSYLDLNALAASLDEPSRFVGLHFFNPADRNPLIEIVRTDTTDEATLATMSKVARRLGKTPILASVDEGFVANRVYADYRMQAEYLVEDGASVRDVDRAMEQLGLSIGPFAVADMSGLDIAWARRKRLAATRDPQQRYVTIADTLCEQGRLGKKTGAGWYDYCDVEPRGVESAKVDAIVDAARAAKEIEPRVIGAEEIQRRTVCAMLVAAAGLVASGTARRASDIDVALTEGFGFPKWLGGPIRFSSAQSQKWVIEGLAEVWRSDPIGFALAGDAANGLMPDAIRDLLDAVRG